MASILDSVKTLVQDSNPFIKIAALSFFVFMVNQVVSNQSTTPAFKNILIVMTALVLIGYVFESIHNNISEAEVILPDLFNPLRTILIGAYGVLVLSPYIALIYYGMTWINSFLTFLPWVNYMILTIAFLTLFALLGVGMLLFCKKYNPLEALNLVKVFGSAGDFIVYNFTLAIGLLVFVSLTFLPIGFFVKITFGYGLVFDYYIIFALVFILMSITQYYSQLYAEYIG